MYTHEYSNEKFDSYEACRDDLMENIEEEDQGYVIRYSICRFRITANNRITPQDGWAGWIRREDQNMTFHHVLETPIYKVLGFIN